MGGYSSTRIHGTCLVFFLDKAGSAIDPEYIQGSNISVGYSLLTAFGIALPNKDFFAGGSSYFYPQAPHIFHCRLLHLNPSGTFPWLALLPRCFFFLGGCWLKIRYPAQFLLSHKDRVVLQSKVSFLPKDVVLPPFCPALKQHFTFWNWLKMLKSILQPLPHWDNWFPSLCFWRDLAEAHCILLHHC